MQRVFWGLLSRCKGYSGFCGVDAKGIRGFLRSRCKGSSGFCGVDAKGLWGFVGFVK